MYKQILINAKSQIGKRGKKNRVDLERSVEEEEEVRIGLQSHLRRRRKRERRRGGGIRRRGRRKRRRPLV